MRLVQDARKTSGFEVSDRIALRMVESAEKSGALRALPGDEAEKEVAVGGDPGGGQGGGI